MLFNALFVTLAVAWIRSTNAQFVPNVVEIEAETADLCDAFTDETLNKTEFDKWHVEKDLLDFSGEGYIIWQGENTGNGEEGLVGRLTYTLTVPRAGTYLVELLSYIGMEDPEDPDNTEYNDSFLRIPGAADFYAFGAIADGRFYYTTYPLDTGKEPEIAGNSRNGFFLVYTNQNGTWSYDTYASIFDPYRIYARFDQAGDYELEIAARSAYHAIDKIRLTEQEFDPATRDFVPEVIEVQAESANLCDAFTTEDAIANITAFDHWELKREIEGFTDIGYIVWEGEDWFWRGAEFRGNVGRLDYTINVVKAGLYIFEWRSYIAFINPEAPASEHNDSWLRIAGAADYFAQKTRESGVLSTLYPRDSGKEPNPVGENGNGFFKIYMNRNDEWAWLASTSDSDRHPIYVLFDEPGEYLVEIAARSSFHAIDKFRLTELEPVAPFEAPAPPPEAPAEGDIQ